MRGTGGFDGLGGDYFAGLARDRGDFAGFILNAPGDMVGGAEVIEEIPRLRSR